MKINDLQVDGFGVWSGLTVEKLPEKLTLFYGPNEAGKTTLMQFVRTVLYGFSDERRARYLPPLHGGPSGGALLITGRGGQFEIRRHLLDEDDPNSMDEATVVSADGTIQGQSQLDDLLGGIDETIYNNVFAIGLRELQELAVLEDTEAAEELYKLTSGLDRVSLIEVMRELVTSRNRLLSEEDRPSLITQLISKRETLAAEIESLSGSTRQWTVLAGKHEKLQREIESHESSRSSLEKDARLLETAQGVRSVWAQRSEIQKKRTALGHSSSLPDRALERLQRLRKQNTQCRDRRKQIYRRRRDIRRQAAKQPINRGLWGSANRIEAIAEHAPWLASLEGQIQHLQNETESATTELQSQLEQLGIPLGSGLQSTPIVNRQTLAALRGPAKAVKEESQRLKQAKEERESNLEQATQVSIELETRMAECGVGDLDEALDQYGDLVSQLRRKVQLEERLDQINRSRRDLEDQQQELLEGQVLSPMILGLLGGVFVVGVMLILAGLFGGLLLSLSGGLGWALALLGFGGLGCSVLWKVMLERNAAQRLKTCSKQLELLESQHDTSLKEQQELDKDLPRGGGPLDARLEAAQEELHKLEEFSPLAAKQQAFLQRSELAEQRAIGSAGSLKTARDRWRAALRSFGLPDSLTPKQLSQLASRGDQMAHLERRVESHRQELESRQRELASLASRVTQLMGEVGMTPDSQSTQEQLQQLTAALSQQQQAIQQRNTWKRQDRQLKKQRERCLRKMKKLRLRRRELLAAGGVSNESEFRSLAQRQLDAAQLTKQENELTSQIVATIGDAFSETDLSNILNDESLRNEGESLTRRREQIANRISEQQSQLQQQHHRLGEFQQQMKTLVADRRLSQVQLEHGFVEQQLKQATRRWLVLATVGRILENIRQIYETERQPETLSEASIYLEKFTGGQYTRVWTPLAERTLLVDDRQGQVLPLEVLSQGTREAVFLSLRLALVAAYGRRGVRLPLVMDDVLVNFDVKRAKAAAVVLRDFAKNDYQILMFTCHEHIMKIFKSAKVDILQLPVHVETRQPKAKPAKKTKVKSSRSKRSAAVPVDVEEEVAELPFEIEEEIVADDREQAENKNADLVLNEEELDEELLYDEDLDSELEEEEDPEVVDEDVEEEEAVEAEDYEEEEDLEEELSAEWDDDEAEEDEDDSEDDEWTSSQLWEEGEEGEEDDDDDEEAGGAAA